MSLLRPRGRKLLAEMESLREENIKLAAKNETLLEVFRQLNQP